MRKLWKIALFLPFLVVPLIVMGADTTKTVSTYYTQGKTSAQMVEGALANIYESDGSDWLGTNQTYRLQRKVMTVPLVHTSSGVDTVWTPLFTVPAGQTITVTEMILSSHLEIDEATDTLHLQVCYVPDTLASVLDTAVASFCVDNDSAIVYADTIYTMTQIDSVFPAGYIVTAWLMAPGGAISAGDGSAITIEYLLEGN